MDLLAAAQPEKYYQRLFDALGEAYWDASDIGAKDQIQGARDAVYKILAGIHRQQLQADTADLLALKAMVKQLEPALKALQADVTKIVRNIDTVGKLEAALAGVLALGREV